MKKNIILCTLAGIACFGAGWLTNQKVADYKASQEWPYLNTSAETIEYYKDSKKFCGELIDAQSAALQKAEIIMDSNNLLDTDGSDDMVDYLELCCKVDSLWKTQL